MSQQQMGFEETNSSIRERGDMLANSHDFAFSPGQKLSINVETSGPSWGLRLTLAIISLVLWTLVFFVVIMIITTTPAQIIISGPHSAPTAVDNSKAYYITVSLLTFGMVVFSAIVIVINYLFNRRR